MVRGQLISIEGIEGVGKSLLVAGLKKQLTARLACIFTREPGGTPVAEVWRNSILHEHNENINADSELLVMFAARFQHWQEVVSPALAAGKVVISDRFVDASYAYQGGGGMVDLAKIDQLVSWVPEVVPDLTLLLDCEVELALTRRQDARGELDKIEKNSLDYFQRVAGVYRQRAKGHPERIKIIDASQTPKQVLQQALALIDDFCREHGLG